ncbi:ABC transporter permease [Limosilactobacillus pontis]|uniref:ABC superfamily ATP binding cassette transporter n=1 Tax=Limosilactobacillus pontis DSM 8475 TaxID=1423794 RepID=A0A922TNJ5_9LACO|nr:ABC transporter permease [Limosilactobacillus pontis]KRM37065.1 ABC superfamily ATP binding cassette transporter [Limosilactobacillus pontis DSM 8475]QFV01266.1 ABC transporter [Limosilactobacillus pontis]
MSNLFNKRRQRHFMMLLKYWRLVFNDHFVIALFFLFGALAYGYAQWLPQLGPHLWWSRWLLVAWFTVLAQVGRLATLVERPDPVFLLPMVGHMQRYLRQAGRYSLALGELMTLAGAFVALPFALTTERLTMVDVVSIFLVAMLAKDSWLRLAQGMISQQWGQRRQWLHLAQWLLPLVVAMVTWLVNPLWGLVLVIAIGANVDYFFSPTKLTIDWRAAVKMEDDRMYSVYRFFNLFTDVPKVQGNVKRRPWANGLIRRLTVPGHPWSYLYARGLLRNTDISGIVIRLTLLAMVVAFVVPITWLNSALVVLFIYLIASQLMPLFDQFDGNVFTHLYPVPFAQRRADFSRLLVRVTALVAALIILASLGMTLNWRQFGVNLVLAVIEVVLLTRLYFRARIKKLSEES